ncbi:MAG TPA: hypothetical protein VL201_01505 [Patescibacteria group bacterium]|jgi:hypothetical protein|nr:hypothetical protein [Patescibacteria group bacterium]
MISPRHIGMRLFFLVASIQAIVSICSVDISTINSVSTTNFELVPYNKNEDSKNFKFLLEKSYIIHRTIDSEELEDISTHFGKTFTSSKEVFMFCADHIELMPGTVYMLKDKTNQKTIGFIATNEVSYDESLMLEINFFCIDCNESNIYDYIKCMFENIVSLAKKATCTTLKIDLQNNKHEQKILSYCKQFGFTILNHPYLPNGFIGLYDIP